MSFWQMSHTGSSWLGQGHQQHLWICRKPRERPWEVEALEGEAEDTSSSVTHTGAGWGVKINVNIVIPSSLPVSKDT